MANPEHVEILKQGSEAWNKWRDKNDYVTPDLRHADLFSANLSGANLRGANFHGAYLVKAKFFDADLRDTLLDSASLNHSDLRGANFFDADHSGRIISRAHLSSASLLGADLSGENLREADFIQADLHDANLRNTDLCGADLRGANLSDAKLENANFLEAYLDKTIITNVDLSKVENLESVRHTGPSSIGIDTIYKSSGNIPEGFLRGCGVPEDFITYMRSLTGSPIEFYSCFISYSSKDEEFTKRLYADLQNEGVRCWFAPEDMKIGDKIRTRIDESIRLHDRLLLVLSENSVASSWVENEVEMALEKEREQGKIVLFPVRLDDAVLEIKTGWPASVRLTRHIGDFTDWKNHDSYKQGFDRLMRDLKAEARK